jgi:type I restriction enzyme S subunit
MQQLFPREGETQPRLRFPEFQNAGEWELKRLGDFASFYKGKGITKAEIVINGRRLCIRYGELYTHYGEVIDDVFSRTDTADADLFLSRSNDIIIPGSGETKLDIAKASCVMHADVALGGDLNVIRTDHNGVFLSYFLNGPKKLEIAKVAQGDTVVHLYPSQLKELVIGLPSEPEQNMIASCLTSLDDLIASQTQRIEALRTHKKGLMQQLFPPPAE